MADRHGLSLLFETASNILAGIIQRESLPNARIDPWEQKDRGVYVLMLTWQTTDGIERVLQLEAVDGLDEVVANISIRALQHADKSVVGGGNQKVRDMINKKFAEVRHVDRLDVRQLSRKLESVLGEAFVSVAQYRPLEPRGFDPGPIKLEPGLFWVDDHKGNVDDHKKIS